MPTLKRSNRDAMESTCRRAQEIIEREAAELPVTAGEQRWVDTHCQTCTACHAFAAALTMLGEGETRDHQDTTAIARAVLAALESRRRQRRIRWALALAAGIVLVSFAGAMWRYQRQAADEAETPQAIRVVAGELSGSVPLVTAGSQVRANAVYTAGKKGATLADGDSLFHLGVGAAASFERRRDERVVALASGRLSATVTLSPAESLEVRTRDCRVAVRGTVFAVEARQTDTLVEVATGVVQVRCHAAEPVAVASGEALGSSSLTAAPMSSDRLALLAGELGLDSLSAPGVPKPGDRDGTVRARRRRPVPPGRRRTAPVKSSSPPTDALFAEVRACMARRDYPCAAAGYRRILALAPAAPESANAYVGLAQLELRHLDDAGAALGSFDAYLTARPGGALEAEALSGKAAALERLGRTDAEGTTLRLLIRRYPLSEEARAAALRLEVLSGEHPRSQGDD